MNEIFHIAITALVFILMILVGTDCTARELRESLKQPWLTTTVSLGQFIIVPALMYTCCFIVGLPAEVTAGLMLIACCPAGAISNTYSYLIGSNTALSVSLTIIASLAAFIATPLALLGVVKVINSHHMMIPVIPVVTMIRELGIMIILPVVIGLAIRAKLPRWISDNQRVFRKIAFATTAALVLLVIGSGPGAVFGHIIEIILITSIYTIVLAATGWLISLVFNIPAIDRWVLLFEFPCRNLAIAAVIGITVLNQPELVRFAAAFFVIQTTVFLVLIRAVNKQRK